MEGYLRRKEGEKHRFLGQLQGLTHFAVDLLEAVKITLLTMRLAPLGEHGVDFTEPLSGKIYKFELGSRT